MSNDSHWDDAYKEVARQSERDDLTAPDLEDTSLDDLAKKITQGAMNDPDGIPELLSSEEAAAKFSEGPQDESNEDMTQRWDGEEERRQRAEQEREERREQFQADKAEADDQGISVGELREKRFDEQQEEPEPQDIDSGESVVQFDPEPPVDVEPQGFDEQPEPPVEEASPAPEQPVVEEQPEATPQEQPGQPEEMSQIVELLRAILGEVASVNEKLDQLGEGGVHA